MRHIWSASSRTKVRSIYLAFLGFTSTILVQKCKP
jgi:hypothetical protein